LNNAPEVQCHYELFHSDAIYGQRLPDHLADIGERNRDPMAYLERIFACADRNIVGFKHQYVYDFYEVPGFVDYLLTNASIEKVLLDREHLLEQYASQKAAERSGTWSVTEPGFEGETRVEFHAGEFFRFAAIRLQEKENARRVLGATGQRWLELSYEETLSAAGIERLAAFLGVATPRADSSFMRMCSYSGLERFFNPQAVTQALRNTRFGSNLGS
jgi:hypothetical protein